MNENEVKKRIRKLKSMELNIRYGYSYDYIRQHSAVIDQSGVALVWNEFFHLSHSNKKTRYSMEQLLSMSEDKLAAVIEEFWFYVFVRQYAARGIPMEDVVDPELLSYLGLPYQADAEQVKKRFRELCKKYHPDEGGSGEQFIELMNMMKRFEHS